MKQPVPLDTDLALAPDHGRAFWLKSGPRRIRAAVWEGGTRGTFIIFNGRSEYIEKYGRVITQLTERGFNVATLDWRGQGLSDRPLRDRMKGHVGGFSAYQNDVDAFLALPEVKALPGPLILLCHSMGGCIGMRALLDERIQPAATIMSAPMLGIFLKPLLRQALSALTFLAQRFDFEAAYAPAPNKARAYVSATDFADNELTGDAEHYNWLKDHLVAEPGFGLGGPTLGWMARAMEEMEALAMAPVPDGPMLMFLGDAETIVDPPAIRAFAARAPRCRLVELEDAHHEVLMETPEIQEQVWAEIDLFLAEQGI